MKHNSSAQKMPRTSAPIAGLAASAGPAGIVQTPPTYGIDSVDRQSAAAPELGQEHQEPARDEPLEMKASPAADSDAGARPENRTGLPDNLKAGVERLSGMAMDDVRV